MDLWSRLIGGGGSTPTKTQTVPNSEQRLAKFKREYSQTLQTWNKALIKAPKPGELITLSEGLRRLTTLLQSDSLAPAPHLCIKYAASTYIYKAFIRVAFTAKDERIYREVVAFLARFVDSDVDAVLGSEKFAHALLTFAERLLESGDFIINVSTEEEILELLFNVVATLRVQPELIQAWFMPESDTTVNTDPTVSETIFEAPVDCQAFPLCRLLISRAHHDGKVGDFARTGMLYLFECATYSSELEEWIVKSELPTLMASGLGALYSHLSRKVTVARTDPNLPFILALSEDHRLLPPLEAESVSSNEFQNRLSTFLQHLVFWQDVLDHCKSSRIKTTLEDHFHSLFLQQILYPSLLQSSDVDGGSSVAVLFYCSKILQILHHPDLIHLFLNYLLALQDLTPSKLHDASVGSKGELTASYQNTLSSDQFDPSFFSLVDLLLASIQSPDSETKTVALRVVSIILHQHHQYAISSLVTISTPKSRHNKRSFGALKVELETLLSVARAIGGVDGMDDGYENNLKDALAIVESHVCTHEILGIHKDMPGNPNCAVQNHCMNLNDALLISLMTLLEQFFTNDIEVNLCLTGVFAHLASCPNMRLDGWLAVDPSHYVRIGQQEGRVQREHTKSAGLFLLDKLDSAEHERIGAFNLARMAPSWLVQHEPTMLKTLRSLIKQLDIIKSDVPSFDDIVAGRKRAFEGAVLMEEEIAEAAYQRKLMQPSFKVTPPGTPMLQATSTTSTIPHRGRNTTSSIAGQSPCGTSSKPPEATSYSWLLSSPLSLLSPQPSTNQRNARGLERSGSPLPLRRAPYEQVQHGVETQTSIMDWKADLIERKILIQEVGTHALSSNAHASKPRQASLGHIITNAVMLQEFIMELAAIMQIRSSMFDGEVRFV